MTPVDDDPAEAALRLEEALERIARAAATGIISAAAKGSGPRPHGSELTARLDSLIADIRLALANQPE